MSAKNKPGSSMLWDEILKAIVDAMPEQLFPLCRHLSGEEQPDSGCSALPHHFSGRKRTHLPDPHCQNPVLFPGGDPGKAPEPFSTLRSAPAASPVKSGKEVSFDKK